MAKTANHVGCRYAVIIGPGPHWFHELQRSWLEQRSQLLTARAVSRTLRVLCCSLRFLLNFLCIF